MFYLKWVVAEQTVVIYLFIIILDCLNIADYLAA